MTPVECIARLCALVPPQGSPNVFLGRRGCCADRVTSSTFYFASAYGRALSETEVSQNFAKLRGRFPL